jgi:DNA-binding CsgD family transcriptional regulator
LPGLTERENIMRYLPLHHHAQAAIIAASFRYWGMGRSSWQIAKIKGCPRRLYILACILHSARKVKES